MHIDPTPRKDKVAHDPIDAALASIEDLLAVLRAPSGKAAHPPSRVSAADRLVDW
jgi:hypothetical protein